MTKDQFLQQLQMELKKIPPPDREEMLYDFEEHFEIGRTNGKDEQEVAHDLGNPRAIAKELLVDYRITQAETDQSVKNMSQVILATISLSLFNLIFVFGPVVGFLGVYVALCATALTLTVSPLAWLVSLIIDPTNVLQEAFVSLALCGFGILASIGLYHFGKLLYNLILKYVKFNLQLIKGGH